MKTALIHIFALASAATAEPIASGPFKADLNPAFPGLLSYGLGDATMTLPATDRLVVVLNGKEYQPTVGFARTGPDAAEYPLAFPSLGVTFKVVFTATRESLTVRVTDIRETGDFVVRTIDIPGLALLAGTAGDDLALGNFPAASYASEEPEDHDIFAKVSGLKFKAADAKGARNTDAAGRHGASYAFVSNGKLAAGIYTNVMDENLRSILTVTGEGDQRAFSAAPGQWTYREIPTETIPPIAKLIVATDNNGDGQVNWQDAAIAYRNNTPRPYGGEKTRDYPIVHIALNFASQATYPFLRVLDNAKKVWLFTDGLGQRIQYKGFAAEGHDSSHPDYAGNVGRRMGGRDDLNFAMRRGHDFSIQSGVHINAHEYHKEAKAFSTDIADLNAIGWCWLDESYLTDYRYDSAYGTLYPRLDAMRADLPYLDFAYLDVYYGRGWPGWRMASKVNSLGILQFTEFPGVMERAVVWNHVANDWTQAIGGKGDRSEIARFIHYSQKDTFQHEPLLRGTNCDGFMGWHGERSMLQTIRSAFTVNLPTKYLQHSQLVRQEKTAAWFSDGARVESDGAVSKMFGRDGQLINSCRYEGPKTRPVDNYTFIPWPPYAEDKIYVWSDKGGDIQGTVPKSWGGLGSAQLYRLTDLGRVFDSQPQIGKDGEVTLSGIAAGTPYVLYRATPPELPDMKWGEGGIVRDPGFDSHTFTAWKATGAVAIENEGEYGQTELAMPGPQAAEVRQTLSGLVPGQTYAASAWVSIAGGRNATLAIEAAPPCPPLFTDRQQWKASASVKSSGANGVLKMLDGKPDTLWHSVKAGDGGKIPPSVTLDFGKTVTLGGFSQTCRPDKGNGTINGYTAAVTTDGKTWTDVATGDFDYTAGTTATVDFKKPVKARAFRLTATSELNGRPFTSIAELEPRILPETTAAAPAQAPVTRTVSQTRLINYTDQSGKYMRNWHRLKVVFTAAADGRADIVLKAADGTARVAFDDARVVKTSVSKPPSNARNIVLFEDFENVDEGWGPFMYGWQGPMNTHLSEANPPYTDDTITGTFSLKSRQEGSPDLLYRTVPATLQLKPDTTYKVSFDYLCDKPDVFAFFAGPDSAKEFKPAAADIIKDDSWKVKHFTTTFKTGSDPDWFIGITKLAKDGKGTIVIDNLLVTE